MLKKILKNTTPPIIYSLIKKVIKRKKRYIPKWNVLNFEPLKGFRIYFDPTGNWQKKMIDGSYDNFLFEYIRKLDLKDKIIYDIGAHIGYHSYYLSRLVGKKGTIHAFEPNPKNTERIELILDKNPEMKNVRLHKIALSNTVGQDVFCMNTDVEGGRSSGGFIEKSDTIWDTGVFKTKGFSNIKVSTTTLDTFIKKDEQNKKPYLIKIDVEGAEFFVLQGGIEMITSYKPIILLEIHSIKSMHDVMNFFSTISYKSEILWKEDDGRCFLKATRLI